MIVSALTKAALIAWLEICCSNYNVDPGLAYGVMVVESRFEVGPLGRKGIFIGPMGIHKDFRKKWNIYDPYENVRVGVAALRGKDKIRVLKRYNTKCNPAYIKAVMQVRRVYWKNKNLG